MTKREAQTRALVASTDIDWRLADDVLTGYAQIPLLGYGCKKTHESVEATEPMPEFPDVKSAASWFDNAKELLRRRLLEAIYETLCAKYVED